MSNPGILTPDVPAFVRVPQPELPVTRALFMTQRGWWSIVGRYFDLSDPEARHTPPLANAALQLTDKLAGAVVTFAVGILMARYLGPHQYGTLSFAIAFVALFSAFGVMGIDSIVVRNLAINPDTRDVQMANALASRVVGGLLVVVLAGSAGFFVFGTEPTLQLSIALVATASLAQAGEVYEWFFLSKGFSTRFVALRLGGVLIAAGLRLALLALGASVPAFAAMIIAEYAIRSWLLWIAYRREVSPRTAARPALVAIIELLQQSWPLALSALSVVLYMRLDQVMIGSIASTTELGIYAAALMISEAWYMLPMVLTKAATPKILRLHAAEPARYMGYIGKLLRALVAINLVSGIAISLAAGPLIVLLFGEEYRAAAGVLMIHIWTGVFVSLGVASSVWLVNEGLQQHALRRTVLGLAVNLALNLVLIPVYGITGAAVATLVAQVIAGWLADAISPATRPMLRMKTRALLLLPA